MDEMQAGTEYHRLAVLSGREIEIAVDRAEGDDITAAIKAQTYSFPRGFSLLVDLVQPGQRVLDLGAHIGTFSLFAATLGYPVLSVEASARNAALLQQSIERNGFVDAIRVVNQAISDRSEVLEFVQAGPYGHVATASTTDPKTSVSAISGDELLAAAGWEDVAFVKMDIEGWEVQAMQGMERLLSSSSAPIFLFESNGYTLRLFDQTPRDLIGAFEQFGYSCYLIDGGQLIPVRSHQLQPACNVDYLATKAPLPNLENWNIRKSLSRRQMREKLLATCVYPHEHNRAYIGNALASAEPVLLVHPQVREAIRALKADPSPLVRASVAWWQEGQVRGVLWIRVRDAIDQVWHLLGKHP